MIFLFILGLGVGLWLFSLIANYRRLLTKELSEKQYWQDRSIHAERYILVLEIPPPDKNEVVIMKKEWENSTKRFK